MGKQWLLYKFTSDGGAGGGCHGTGKSSSTSKTTKAAGKYSRKTADHVPTSSSSSSGGCMSAIFHLFDIQHHHFPFHQPSFISDSFVNIPQESNIIHPGVEAPRNSLELDEELVASSSSSSSSKPKQETNLNIPMGGIQIKTKRSRLMMDDVSSECSSSPSTKTPNVVARLMGLDLLPENSSPRPSLSSPRPSSSSSYATPLNPLSKLSSSKQQSTRSLPVTPRISTAARPSTDVDYHHRLSLQINKENRRRSEMIPVNRRDDESSSEYAKQIAKQVRENISKRVGVDITNTMKKKEERRDQCLVVLKPKRRSLSPSSSATSKENEPPVLSCSARLRLLEIKNNLKKPISNPPLTTSTELTKAPSSSSSNTKPLMMMEDLEKVQLVKQDQTPVKVQKYKKIASEKYDLRLKKKHQQEEPFVKKCNNNNNKKKSTPLSNRLLNVNTTTKFISFKKDMASSSPSSTTTTTALPQKQKSIQQLPRCQNRSYNTNETHKLSVQDNVSTREDNYSNCNGVATAITGGGSVYDDDDYFEYISRILSHSGIEKTTAISVAHWYSPSHPLHPSIFHHLEELLQPTGNFPNRKLIFEVVDEVLVEILKPYISFKPWAAGGYSHRMYGWELIEMIRRKIKSFPAADCQVLEDIDGLIAGDLRSSTRAVGAIAFEEEAEELVKEMEREMVETLVDEMARSDGGHVHGGFT
ncbi:uncharacterized protein LOC112526463 [Cynara cardunculus var. scolymus]|uniref:DUF4378 domain-containing protein n=1 Tax=Cynara cardunculus var. scolymus TaxID=59895 RepID=A0A103YJA8_CYNCS|nr:uncharacterized protein LOC112526463 [Cynara cardunculus var. scolymus]KVI10103.1 protein of unknown function DUF4378 [Cynara cardunculus var. scolymus]